MRYVIFPQAFRVIYPPLCNQFIGIILWSSLVSDHLGPGSGPAGEDDRLHATFRSFEIYTVVTLIYVVMTLTISVALKLLGPPHVPAGRLRWAASRISPKTS